MDLIYPLPYNLAETQMSSPFLIQISLLINIQYQINYRLNKNKEKAIVPLVLILGPEVPGVHICI